MFREAEREEACMKSSPEIRGGEAAMKRGIPDERTCSGCVCVLEGRVCMGKWLLMHIVYILVPL